MARYVAAARGASPTITTHLDRRAAIDGADFVLNMVQIGGHEATLRDFEIPARYGLRQTIADTLGIGGIFRTLRTAAHMLALGNEMAELCPPGVAPQLHEPDGDALPARLPGHADEQRRRALPLGAVHRPRSLRSSSACPQERGHVPLGGRSTTRRSSCASSTTARSCIPASTSGSPPIPSCSAASASRSTGGFGYFQTESSEHAAEYVPWFMRHDDELERYRVPVDEYITRSEENLIEFERVKEALARRRADAARALERVRRHDRQLDGHRRAERGLRQRAEHGADPRAAARGHASRCRASWTERAFGRRRCSTTRRSWRR